MLEGRPALSARQIAILKNIEDGEEVHPKFLPLEVKECAFIKSTNKESFQDSFFRQILLHLKKGKSLSGEGGAGSITGEKATKDLASFYRDTDAHRILGAKTKKELLHDADDLGIGVDSSQKKSDLINQIVASLLE
jgi:hypothetical protein